MKIRFLGTAAAEGVPALFCVCDVCKNARKLGGREIRTRSGALIDGVLKIDLPPDTLHHLYRDGLDLTPIRSIIVTHSHEDHFTPHELGYRSRGFADLPEDYFPLKVYGNAAVGALTEKTMEGFGAGGQGRVEFEKLTTFAPREIEGYTVTALTADHMIDQPEVCHIYLIEKDGRSLLYGNDTGFFPDETLNYLAGRKINVISLDCTGAAKDYSRGHMGFLACQEMRRRLHANGAADENTVFVAQHFSHNGGMNYQGMIDEYPDFVIAYDGMEIDV